MNKIRTVMLLLAMYVTMASAQTKVWIDVTDQYIVNPRFDNNDYHGWSGTAYGAANPKENAEHYNRNYDTYQTLTGLPAGQYRLSLDAFYRAGSATNDYNTYRGNNYESSQHAVLYARSTSGEVTTPLPYASSGGSTQYLGGAVSRVG